MFKSKSFDLIKEEEKKSRAEAKTWKCRYMKYVFLAALIGFILLLILVNVDFSPDDPTNEETMHDDITLSSTLPEVSHEKTTRRMALRMPAIYCSNTDHCEVTCKYNVEDFSFEVDKLVKKKWCSDQPISATLENCDFDGAHITKNFFKGNFTLGSLTIQNCDVAFIDEGAFAQPSLKDLHSLVLDGTHFNKLDDKSFLGLGSLRLFKMKNVPQSPFTGISFLTPFAGSLMELMLLVTVGSLTQTVYEPRDWLKGENLKKLTKVDLSGNVFHDKLTSATFRTLVQVEHLTLFNCSIDAIDVATFDPIMGTLKHLDLRSNKLKALDWGFLKKVLTPGFILELSNNLWNCSCDNDELIKYAKGTLINFMEYPTCADPSDLKDEPIQSVELKCVDDTTTTAAPTEGIESSTETASSSIGIASTTSATINTPEVSSSTEISTTTTVTITAYSTSTTTSTDNIGNTTTTQPPTTTKTTSTESPTLSTLPTPPSPPTTTTTTTTTSTPAHPIRELTCSNSLGNPHCANIWDHDVVFHIKTISPNSVQLLGVSDVPKMEVIYCLNESSQQRGSSCQRRPSNPQGIISDLINNQAYVFCLVKPNQQELSPFNCRSHFLEPFPSQRAAWLLYDDIRLFVVLAVIGIVVCIICGMLLTYTVLRCRPSLLKGSKRLRRADNKSAKMLLYPKNLCSAKEHEHYYLSSYTGKHLAEGTFAINYEASFIKKGSAALDHLNDPRELLPPVEPAPGIPESRNGKRQRSWDMALILEDDTETNSYEMNEYESLEYYQELF